jgi:hypothetical protein
MNEILPILAQSLAPDNVWFALLLMVVLALLHSLSTTALLWLKILWGVIR